LIHIKVAGDWRSSLFNDVEQGGLVMPTETTIVVAGIVLVFAVFMAALAWASYYTRNFRAPGAKY
jgi:hypothetical protein